jgi:hypothetical protein
MSIRDWLGEEIKVGSEIIYPIRYGSSLHIVKATVIEIVERNGRPMVRVKASVSTEGYRDFTRVSNLERIDRITVLK